MDSKHRKLKGGLPATFYAKKKGIRELIKRRPRGPAKGQYTPVQDRIEEDVVAKKMEHPELGSAKIGVMAGVDASPKTVHAALKKNGFKNVTMRIGKAYRSFEMDRVNEMWQIDFVELGVDRITGRKVEFLSVIDDKSRMILSEEVTVHATTEHVLEVLTACFMEYGVPEKILSDRGTQWCASNGGDTRFDAFCEEWGIEHAMGKVRKPTTQGKVERWHGSIRMEAGIPKTATLDEYQAMMASYVRFYNTERPHWSCGLRTPYEAFHEGHTMPLLFAAASCRILEAESAIPR